MPSSDYNDISRQKNYEGALKTSQRQNFSHPNPSQADSFRQRTIENYNSAARRNYQQDAGGKATGQKEMQNKLKRLQKTNMGKTIAKAATGRKNPVTAAISIAFSLFSQIRLSVDWSFLFLLIPFAFLKDIIDIVFAGLIAAATGTIILGPAVAGVGMTVSFVTNLMLQILSITCLLIVGANLKNRGLAKYIIIEMLDFLAESFPGLGWLPWATIFAIILYFLVLLDRYLEKEEQKKAPAEGASMQPAAAEV
jgi:hypothetical protein